MVVGARGVRLARDGAVAAGRGGRAAGRSLPARLQRARQLRRRQLAHRLHAGPVAVPAHRGRRPRRHRRLDARAHRRGQRAALRSLVRHAPAGLPLHVRRGADVPARALLRGDRQRRRRDAPHQPAQHPVALQRRPRPPRLGQPADAGHRLPEPRERPLRHLGRHLRRLLAQPREPLRDGARPQPSLTGAVIIATVQTAAAAPLRALAHLPGERGLPFIGHAIEFATDPRRLTHRLQKRYGDVFRTSFLGTHAVVLLGEEALELVLRDRDANFSSRLGWGVTLERLFPNGLMLRDFEDHRFHRRIMQAAFKTAALEDYLDRMNARIAEALPAWGEVREFRFYPRLKQLTLDNAASVFLGVELGPEADRLNRAFVDSVEAALAIVRVPIPGLALHRGIVGRQLLVDFLRARIPERRGSDRPDMFSQLCRAVDEEGRSFSDDDVVDHMVFLLMAAHDTVTSALTSTAFYLARHPEWQERLREVSRGLGTELATYDDLNALSLHQQVFEEVLRLHTPVPYIPRRTIREIEFNGHRLPANTHVSVVPDHTHHDARLWSQPWRFDPDRFGPERAEHKRHPFAFVPFGGGAHLCIGKAFAYMLAKIFLHQLVLRYRLHVPATYAYRPEPVPIPKPVDGLPLTLERV
ncbi:MAG: cytochrome P450 [Sandaracinaceae bacterium]|nr:cytochrome P450 [Sandaracinaceae bacterium]